MSTRVSTKQKLLNQLEDADSILQDILGAVTKRGSLVNLVPLIELLIEKDQQMKETYKDVKAHFEMQKKIDLLRADCAKSDKLIHACQLQLKKAEAVVSTALYYSRQKLDSMAAAVKSPIDPEELVRFAHRISASHGVIAPDNWVQGDPRRPYPNKEEIRRGYLGRLDDSGNFRSSMWEALSETAAAAATISSSVHSSSTCTPGSVHTSGTVFHTTQLTTPITSGSLPMDQLAISSSPNMILPGVNMVSSPMPVTQSSTSWSAANFGTFSNNLNGTDMMSPQNPSPRPPNHSLAAMLSGSDILDHHSRISSNAGLLPPSLKLTSNQSSGSVVRVGPGFIRSANLSGRSSFPQSPSLLPGSQSVPQPHCDQGSRISQPLCRSGRHKQTSLEDVEMSSNSSSFSSGEE